MPKLSGNATAALIRCAKAMASQKDEPELDLSHLGHDFQAATPGLLEFLRIQVHQQSNRSLTVRLADPALFAEHLQGQCLYLALCPITEPAAMATDLELILHLYTLAPLQGGLRIAYPADADQVASYHTFAGNSRKQAESLQQFRNYQTQGQEVLDALLAQLYREVELLAARTTDPELKLQLERCIRGGPDGFGLKDAATAAAITGQDLTQFLWHVVNR